MIIDGINIEETYKYIKNNRNPKIKMPSLLNKEKYCKAALALVFYYKKSNKNKYSSITDFGDFLRKLGINGSAEAHRGLKKNYGWNLQYGPGHNGVKLVSIKTIAPSWIKNQHLDKITNWSELKKSYNNKCATCGAKEGESHPKDKTIKVKLEKGHINPNGLLEDGNTIPQCSICNKTAGNKWIFNNKGLVSALNKLELILKSPESVQKSVFELLKKKFEKDLVLQQDSI